MNKIAVFLYLFVFFKFAFAQNTLPTLPRVAHGGGAFEGEVLTNSLDALNANYANGFRYFEVDLSLTRDGHLVCLHDWKTTFRKIFKFKITQEPTLETFLFLVKNATPLHLCDLSSLNTWLIQHPDAKLITDIKKDNLKSLIRITHQIVNYRRQIIPQCYQPKNCNKIKNLGFQYFIFTLYRYDGDDKQVLNAASAMDNLLAVTMPVSRAKTSLVTELLNQGIPTYIHTVNDVKILYLYQNKYRVTEIYTDFILPNNNELKKIPDHSSLRDIDNHCMATYHPNGQLHIPCLLFFGSDNKEIYEVTMHRQFPEYIFYLDLNNVW